MHPTGRLQCCRLGRGSSIERRAATHRCRRETTHMSCKPLHHALRVEQAEPASFHIPSTPVPVSQGKPLATTAAAKCRSFSIDCHSRSRAAHKTRVKRPVSAVFSPAQRDAGQSRLQRM